MKPARHAALLVCLLLLGACETIEPAPKDLDGLAHWFWLNYTAADDAEMADAVDKLHRALDADALEEPGQGTVSRLSSAELEHVEMQDRDPDPAVGLYITGVIRCGLGALEEVLWDLNQDEMYSEAYDSFERSYTSDFDAYRARDETILTWTATYEATPLPAARYRATMLGGLRYVPTLEDEEGSPLTPAIIQRSWMPRPAEYLDTDANEFDLDFHVEVYYQRGDGEIVHFYPLWRHLAFNGIGLSTDDTSVQDMILDGFVDWDVRTEELCQ